MDKEALTGTMALCFSLQRELKLAVQCIQIAWADEPVGGVFLWESEDEITPIMIT